MGLMRELALITVVPSTVRWSRGCRPANDLSRPHHDGAVKSAFVGETINEQPGRIGITSRCQHMIRAMDPLEMLAQSELFEGASPADFEALARSARIKHYNRRDLIFGAGDNADAMYLVLVGEVVVSRLGPDGDEYVVEAFVAGDVMGPLHFFERSPIRTLDARATDATSCWIASRQDFMRLLERNPKLMLLMLRTYSRWIVQRDIQDADSSFRNVAGQVATKLLHLADRYGEPARNGVRIGLHVTETTLANMIGASRENVSRAIAQLQRAGDIRRERGFLVLTHPDELRLHHSWVTGEEARTVSPRRRASSMPRSS